MKHTKLVALAGTAALALTLSACGGGDSPALPTTPGTGGEQTTPAEQSPSADPTTPEATTPEETTPEETTPAETTPEETTDAGGTEPIPTGDVSIFSFTPTVCSTFDLLNNHPDNDPELGFQTIPGVDCNGPHDIEFFHNEILPEGEFPGDEAIMASAEEACLGRFEEYVGTPYLESKLDWDYIAPNDQTWQSGDRELLCIIYDPYEVPTGSFQGSGM